MKNIFDSLSPVLKKKLMNISFIVLDFDGVLTDNKVLHSENGQEYVLRNKADSLAIDLLNSAGLYNKEDYKSIKHRLDIMILSKESNPVIKSISEKIKIKYQNSVHKKLEVLQQEISLRGIDIANVLFIGNDLNDIACIKAAGIGVAVSDSFPQVNKNADYVTSRKGGEGALREICELIMYTKQVHPFP